MPAKKLTTDDYRKRQIKSAMAAKGLTGKNCASKMHIDGSVYSRMISNISSCRVRDVEMICNVLGMDIKELLGVRA